MPRAFSESEREIIGARLAEAGLAQFCQHGLRRTNVASLARAAGIAKGSFYLFFPSKEALLLSLLDSAREARRASLDAVVEDASLVPRDRIERFLRLYAESFAGNPLQASLRDPEEAVALDRLAPGVIAQARQADDDYFVRVMQEWQDAGELTPLEPATIEGLGRALRVLALEHDAIGPERWPRTLTLFVAALADSLAW